MKYITYLLHCTSCACVVYCTLYNISGSTKPEVNAATGHGTSAVDKRGKSIYVHVVPLDST